jgi:hypothetical protein
MPGTGVLLLLLALPARQQDAPPLPEGNALAQSMLGRQRAREALLDKYTYDVEEAEEQLDSKGRVTKRESEAFEVFYVKGLPVRRQVGKNGRPLDAKQQAKEDARVKERVTRIEQGRVTREQVGLRISQILERYEFRTLARQERGGRPTLELQFEARPGKRDLDSDNVLRALAGTLWVDEEERAVAGAAVRNTQGIKFALGLGASVKSLEIGMDFRRLEAGVWLPERVVATYSGRMLLFKSFRRRHVTKYSNYRRFEADTEEIYDTPVPR